MSLNPLPETPNSPPSFPSTSLSFCTHVLPFPSFFAHHLDNVRIFRDRLPLPFFSLPSFLSILKAPFSRCSTSPLLSPPPYPPVDGSIDRSVCFCIYLYPFSSPPPYLPGNRRTTLPGLSLLICPLPPLLLESDHHIIPLLYPASPPSPILTSPAKTAQACTNLRSVS